MKFTSEENKMINTVAWRLRRKAAYKYNCKVLEISWKHCIQIARKQIEKVNKIIKKHKLDKRVKKASAFDKFIDLLFAEGGYRPTLNSKYKNNAILAHRYNQCQTILFDYRKAYITQ